MRLRQGPLVAYIATVHGLIHTIEFTYAVLLSRIEDEFGAGLFALGALATVFAFAFGFSALPSGLLVDRLGTQRVLLICFSLASVAALLTATAPNPAVLGVFLALLGLSVGLYHPAGLSFIAQATERRGLALGWHGVVGNLGIAVAPVVAVGVALALDWRWAYVLLALLCEIVALSLRLVRFEPLPAARPLAEVEEAAPAPSRRMRARALLPLLLVYGVFVLNGFVYRGSLTFLPKHFENTLGEGWLTSSLATLALLGGAAGQLVGGALSERYRLERLALPMTLALLPALLLMGTTGGAFLVVFSAAFVFANFSGQPVYTGLIADYTPARAMGRSYGISFFAGFGLGSSAAAIAGFFAGRWGTDSVFLALACVAAVTSLLAFAIWRLGERAAREGAADD